MSRTRLYFMVAFLGMAFISTAGIVSASTISEIPQAINNALFDGTNLYAARMILAGCIMMTAILCMALVKLPVIGIAAMTLTLMGILTAIGWLDYWILVFTAILIGFMFSRWIAEKLSPESGTG